MSLGFHLITHVPVQDDLTNLVLATIGLVWEYHSGPDAEFSVEFASRIEHGEAGGPEAYGAYVHSERRFAFAIQPTGPHLQLQALRATMVTVAGHEAMHAIQYYRGSNPDTTLASNGPGSPTYNENPFEIEAHEESILVLKGYHPDLPSVVPMGGREYPVPSSSPYEALWDHLERDGAKVRVISRQSTGGRTDAV